MTCVAARESFAAIAPEWGRLLGERSWSTLFLTPEWQRSWWDQFGTSDADLCLLTIGPSEAPLGIAPMVMEGDRMTFVGDTDLFDYHDFIDVKPGFHETFAECVADEPWKVMDLRSVPAFSPAIEELPEAFRSRGCEVTIEDEDVVPGVELPATWDEYLANLRKKDRHELRRKMRRLEGSGDVQVVEADPSDLGAHFEAFCELMAESSEEKRDFLKPDRRVFFERLVQWTAEAGYLRMHFLELDGEKVSATMSFDYAGRRLLYNSGYRLEYGQLAVGLMLKALVIKDAIERGLTYFDFLRGPESYKYHLGGQDVGLCRIVVTR